MKSDVISFIGTWVLLGTIFGLLISMGLQGTIWPLYLVFGIAVVSILVLNGNAIFRFVKNHFFSSRHDTSSVSLFQDEESITPYSPDEARSWLNNFLAVHQAHSKTETMQDSEEIDQTDTSEDTKS